MAKDVVNLEFKLCGKIFGWYITLQYIFDSALLSWGHFTQLRDVRHPLSVELYFQIKAFSGVDEMKIFSFALYHDAISIATITAKKQLPYIYCH